MPLSQAISLSMRRILRSFTLLKAKGDVASSRFFSMSLPKPMRPFSKSSGRAYASPTDFSSSPQTRAYAALEFSGRPKYDLPDELKPPLHPTSLAPASPTRRPPGSRWTAVAGAYIMGETEEPKAKIEILKVAYHEFYEAVLGNGDKLGAMTWLKPRAPWNTSWTGSREAGRISLSGRRAAGVGILLLP